MCISITLYCMQIKKNKHKKVKHKQIPLATNENEDEIDHAPNIYSDDIPNYSKATQDSNDENDDERLHLEHMESMMNEVTMSKPPSILKPICNDLQIVNDIED
eukprot:92344_1